MEILIPINTSVRRTVTGAYYTEQDMFYIATISRGLIHIAHMELDEENVRRTAQLNNLPLVDYLRKGISSDPILYNTCLKQRVGYTPVKQLPNDYEQVDTVKIEQKRWDNFIVKILQQKQDYINLNEYRKKVNE